MRRRPAQEDIELAIGPHPARPDWRILRITYAVQADHDQRVMAALAALFNSPRQPTTGAEPQGDKE